MAEMMIFNRNKAESGQIVSYSRDAVAIFSDDRLVHQEYTKAAEVKQYLAKGKAPELSVMEIAGTPDIQLTISVREHAKNMSLLLVADAAISPMEYLRPEIRASSLLLRPYPKEKAKQVISTYIRDYYRQQTQPDTENELLIENRQGTRKIAFSQICYLEVIEKKVYIRLRDREYSQYGSLEQFQKLLPPYFVRCHRSYICNMQYVERVRFSENCIEMEYGMNVPLSRSAKQKIREYLDEL